VCQGILTVMNENGHCECHVGGSHNEVECGLVYFGIVLGSLVGVIVVLIIIIILIKLFTVGVALLVALIVECKNCKSDANDARRSPVVTPEPEAETERDTCHPHTVFGPPIPIESFITQTSNSACPNPAVCHDDIRGADLNNNSTSDLPSYDCALEMVEQPGIMNKARHYLSKIRNRHET